MFLLVLHRSVLPLQKLQVKLKVQILYISTNTCYSKRNHKIDKWLGCENASLKIAKQLKLYLRSSLSSTPETTGQALPVLLALTESCCLGVWSCLPLGFCLSLYCVTCFLYVNFFAFMFYSLDLLLFLDFGCYILKFAFSVAARFLSAIAVEWNLNKSNYKTDDWWRQVCKV